MPEGARERPVRLGAGLAEEVIGSPEAGRHRPGTRRLVLAADGHTQTPSGLEHAPRHRRQQTDVMVGVEVGRLALHQVGELLDLRVRPRARRRAPRPATAAWLASRTNRPSVVDERGAAGERPSQGEVEVNARRPARSRGARASCSASIVAVTSTVVLVTMPWRCADRMPSLTPGVRPKSSALTMSRRVTRPSPGSGSLDHEPLDGLGDPGRHRGLEIDGADVLEPLVPDPRERLDLAAR